MDQPVQKVTKKRVVRKKAVAEPTNVLVSTSTVTPATATVATVATVAQTEKRPTCGICIEPYNKVANTEVICCFCEKSACRRCVQTFITTSTNDPHCMHCSKLWEREFIDDNLTVTYRMNEYKKHRENILLDREIALMPATQYRAEQIRSADKMEKEIMPPLDTQLKKLYEDSAAITVKINTIYKLRNDAQYQIRLLRTGHGEKAKTEVTFVRKCPDGDCRGFLSTAWKCGLCSKWACPECHEIKGTERDAAHECKPENVATAKLLAKDSRPCPGCGTVITKIEGCDQMWCPQCHTPFSWRTGQKETGVVHNPHFYEWQRKQNGGVAPRVVGDVACGGIPHYTEVRNNISGLSTMEKNMILNFHRIIQHVQHAELPRYHNVFNENDNQDLRINYLLGYTNADTLKVTIQQREKKREKERAIRRALEVLVQAGTDLLRRIMVETDINKKAAILDEVDALRIYINDLLAKVHDRLKLSVEQYKSDWTTHHPFSPTAKRAEKLKEQQRLEKIKQQALVRAQEAALIMLVTENPVTDATQEEARRRRDSYSSSDSSVTAPPPQPTPPVVPRTRGNPARRTQAGQGGTGSVASTEI
jgi:hypothetical protein